MGSGVYLRKPSTISMDPFSTEATSPASSEATSPASSPDAILPPSLAPPEAAEARGKRVKLEPKAPWEYKRMEDLEESDFSMYDDYSEPYMFACKRFVYKNKAMIHQEEAIAEYRERSRNLSPYDAIAPPPNSRLCGSVRPFLITDDLRPRLINLFNLALEKYNAENLGANFVFDDLVKTTGKLVCGVIFYITFEAKDASNGAARTFQAQVWDTMLPKDAKPPVVESCSMQPT